VQKRIAVASFIFLFLSARAVQAQSDARQKTVLDGVYSIAQAELGHSLYTAHCSACHGNALEGVSAPPLTGNRFIERWREGVLGPLYDFIRERMPFGRPPNAKPILDSEYLDILTYILKVNGYRAAESELTPGLLGTVLLVGLNGPQPVPDGAHVMTVGCLSQVGDGLWVLSHATEPARTPTESLSNPADLKTSLQKKLGTLTFRLADLEAVPDFSPSAHDGHKIQVKGFLTRQPNAERISLSSVEMLESSCGG
jgi:mono/diheme cytochrome c family protein